MCYTLVVEKIDVYNLKGIKMGIFEKLKPEVISQIFGIIGIALSIFIYAAKSRSKIIVFKFSSDVVWALNYLFAGAYTGALLNTIGMARETVFYNRGHKKWASHRFWLYVFIALTFLSPILEFIKLGHFSLVPLLPAAGSIFAVISFYSIKPKTMRILGLIAQILWTVYNVIVENPTAFIACILIIVSIFIGMFREWHDNHKEENSVQIKGLSHK